MRPSVSVLIPYYNDSRFLRESITSVLEQEFADFELVLVNHASTDGSRAIARSFSDPRIVHVDMPFNHGAGGGLVVAEFLKVARGEYVKFFCADDIMRPECLAKLVDHMDSHPGLSFAFGDLEYINVSGKDLGAHWFEDRPKFSVDLTETDCLRLFAAGHSFLPWVGSIVRRSALSEIELDATMVMMFDMSVWAQLLLGGHRLGFVESVLASYRVHDGQVSALAHRNEAICLSVCERQVFFRYFQRCRDVALVKEVFDGSEFIRRIQTVADIPLAVALRYVANDKYAIWAYQYVHDCLQDPAKRTEAEERMGLTVAGFRGMIRRQDEQPRKKSRWMRFRDRWLRFRSSDGSDEFGKYSL